MKILLLFKSFFITASVLCTTQSWCNEIVITSHDSLEKITHFAAARRKKWKGNKDCFLKKHNILSKNIEETISFMRTILDEDKKTNQARSRLQDPLFLQKEFEWIPLKPHKKQALNRRGLFPPGVKNSLDTKILLTKYASFKVNGSHKKTDHYSCALYRSFDYKHSVQKTKQEIIDGALDAYPSLYRPLVWVTRKDLKKALMQGTVVVLFPNKVEHVFNIHVHNRYPHDSKSRYWFFRQVKDYSLLPSHHIAHILKTDHASFAGDLHYFGMGSLLTVLTKNPLNKKNQRVLGFLVDTGAAFKDNQFQLDLFVGLCESDDLFQKRIKSLSENGIAHMLIKKRTKL